MFQILFNALQETLFMVIAAGCISALLGIPAGLFIANMSSSPFKSTQIIYHTLFNVIKIIRSIPFLFVMLLFIPITNWLISMQLSYMTATILPLSLVGTLYVTVKTNDVAHDLLQKWTAASKAMGANLKQKLQLIIIPEALPQIIQESAEMLALLISLSTIAGALGAGGLGQLAIEKSITDPDPLCVILSIGVIVVLQQLVKYTGKLYSQK